MIMKMSMRKEGLAESISFQHCAPGFLVMDLLSGIRQEVEADCRYLAQN